MSEITVKIYLPEDEDTVKKRRQIEVMLQTVPESANLEPIFHRLEEEDWANAWREHYHPFRVGQAIWIRPSWYGENDGAKADDIILTLDPGMAFGTGSHATTRMCLQGLEQLLKPGISVLDVGTGSGILAILAAKMGATPIWAVDTDELAVKTAVANAQQNDVAENITFQQGSLTSIAQKEWDVVVVNILAPVIMTMLAQDDLLSYMGTNGRPYPQWYY